MSQKLIELRHHIQSVENIKATTQTMSTVAAAKLARSRNKAASLRTYAEKMREIVQVQSYYIAEMSDRAAEISPLFQSKPGEGKTVFVVIGSDIGMCGSYNGQIGRLALSRIEELQAEGQVCAVYCKGIKSEEFFRRKTKIPIIGMEKWSEEGVSINDAINLLRTMVKLFNQEDIKEIYCAYTKFYSPVKREPTILKMLPLSFDILPAGKFQVFEDWIYEPDAITILKELIPTYFRVQVFDMLLESYASEQGARMMAMEEASDRAEETLRELRVAYNKMRRDLITLDLLGILSAANVIEMEAAKKAGGLL
ncbi:MAG: ATP synthase F1 subunit gamma [bacterium]|nr:ATP synthase F1 subunit gamma [bacterium]